MSKNQADIITGHKETPHKVTLAALVVNGNWLKSEKTYLTKKLNMALFYPTRNITCLYFTLTLDWLSDSSLIICIYQSWMVYFIKAGASCFLRIIYTKRKRPPLNVSSKPCDWADQIGLFGFGVSQRRPHLNSKSKFPYFPYTPVSWTPSIINGY